MKLHAPALGSAGAVTSAVFMLLLSIADSLGIYKEAVMQMQKWHVFYSPDLVGTITGMIEAAVFSFIAMYIFAVAYNAIAK